jgi:TPR repeat protein
VHYYQVLILGLFYAGKYGEPPDPARAAEWYRKAANGGNVEAQFALGLLHLNGKGVPADPVAAATWIEKAAHADHPAARGATGSRARDHLV